MKKKKKVVILSGAGVSAESGIPTFRASDGLWEGHDVMDVATPEGWAKDQDLVLQFYNERRKKALSVEPNDGHKVLADLDKYFEVVVITQNVDNLHEQAGSKRVLHLHGELSKARSTVDESLVYDIEGWELKKGDKCEKGSQLRPHIVWFGEDVPMIETAATLASMAEIFIVVGTSMLVYPAAGLIDYVPANAEIYVVDPKKPNVAPRKNLHFIEDVASKGLQQVADILKSSL